MVIAAAFIIDLLVGDPAALVAVHPVVLIGRLVSYLERLLYRQASRFYGALLVTLICGTAYLSTRYAIIQLGRFGLVLEIWLLSTAFAARGLFDAGMRIYAALKNNDLSQARQRTAEIVGRDTEQLEEPEIVRAAVESVAENLVDGVTAPLFYAFLGGAPLAIMYKAINTMDSMLGHKDERYFYFGWAAARLDDVANYIPARLTSIALIVASALLRLDACGCFRSIKRDANKHASPNAGWPEAGVAGALGVTLGGTNYYDGEPIHTAVLGDGNRTLELTDIVRTAHLMLAASSIFLCLGTALSVVGRVL